MEPVSKSEANHSTPTSSEEVAYTSTAEASGSSKSEESEPKRWDGAESDIANLDGTKDDDSDDSDAGSRDDYQEGDEELDFNLSSLTQYFRQALGFMKQDVSPEDKVLDDLSLKGVANYIKTGKCKNIIVMVGAGISTSAGIPDFRSPDTGLYSQLAKYNLPTPEAIFEINYFKEHPEPFFKLAKELLPGTFKPTTCHYFLKMLHDEGLLRRLYTQNIDGLERQAGVPAEKVVEAHGTFYTSHCLGKTCRTEYSFEWMKEKILKDVVPTCEKCNTVVKPDIIFFSEQLPARFFVLAEQDFPNCDLLIVIGTSLQVQPFASLIDNVNRKTPRLLINKTKAGNSPAMSFMLGMVPGMNFDSKDNYRDVFWQGTSDDGCKALADALGWTEKLNKLTN